MEVIAKARYIRMSARKVRLVAGLIRGMDLDAALQQLRFYRKAASRPVLKCVESAAANAEHNFKLNRDSLFIKSIMVDIGPSMKRWRARAFGRAAGIKKHSCHITVILADREKGGASKSLTAATLKPAAKAETKAAKAKAEPKEKKAVSKAKPAKKATKE